MVAVSLTLLVLFLIIGIPVAAAVGLLGITLSEIFIDLPLTRALGEIAWGSSTSVLLLAVPLFIFLGEILLRSGIADRMYSAIAQWLSWLPGGLMHSNVGACMMFAATAGSSAATAATIGTVALPQLKRHHYNERLFMGSLASGGTLGILIPPSINLIIYGWLTETSVPALYLAGFVPGIVLGTLFIVTILIACVIRPAWGGTPVETSWKKRISTLPALLPPLAIFLLVIGSIYAGVATPTESASLGVCGALVLAAANRSLTWSMLRSAVEGCVRTTGMILLIMLAAFFLNFVFSVIGLTTQLSEFLAEQGLGQFGVLFVVVAFYVALGCLMEPLPLMIITVPIFAPIIAAAGFDLVWFGILVVILLEMALITPPVGINLFVVQGVRRHGSINDVMIGAAPFVVTIFVMIGLVIAFPGLALWLPEALGR